MRWRAGSRSARRGASAASHRSDRSAAILRTNRRPRCRAVCARSSGHENHTSSPPLPQDFPAACLVTCRRQPGSPLGAPDEYKETVTMLKRIVAAAILTAMAVSPAAADDRAVVIEWNQLLQSTAPGTLGLQGPRYYAMLHIAMFDAVNSIERTYGPYVVKV